MSAAWDERFWSKVAIGAASECWEWLASRQPNGYGKFGVPGHTLMAHRVAYCISIGEPADGLCVLHRCDNPSCCNPDHLFLGTQTENMMDKLRKGRQPTGERNKASRVSDEEVRAIRVLSILGFGPKKSHAQFGISYAQAWNIATGRSRA